MFQGPMEGVWEMLGQIEQQFPDIVTIVSCVLIAAGVFYTMWVAWRKYRMVTSRI